MPRRSTTRLGRILSFYAPFLLLAAAPLLAKRDWDLPLLGAQAACVLVMAAVLPVVPLDLNPRPEGPRTDVPSFDDLALTASGAVFDGDPYAGRFTLTDYRFVANVAEQIITLETHWQGDARTERPYRFEVVARAENELDGQIVTEPYAWYPQNGNYLTTCWAEGDAVRDVVNVPLPRVSMPVVWTLTLRAVDERTGHVAGVAEIGPIRYP
jgi:hypothetical protein